MESKVIDSIPALELDCYWHKSVILSWLSWPRLLSHSYVKHLFFLYSYICYTDWTHISILRLMRQSLPSSIPLLKHSLQSCPQALSLLIINATKPWEYFLKRISPNVFVSWYLLISGNAITQTLGPVITKKRTHKKDNVKQKCIMFRVTSRLNAIFFVITGENFASY